MPKLGSILMTRDGIVHSSMAVHLILGISIIYLECAATLEVVRRETMPLFGSSVLSPQAGNKCLFEAFFLSHWMKQYGMGMSCSLPDVPRLGCFLAVTFKAMFENYISHKVMLPCPCIKVSNPKVSHQQLIKK